MIDTFKTIPAKRMVILILPAILLLTAAAAQAGQLYVVLMAGQSNMAGRGAMRYPIDTVTNQRILSLDKDSLWVQAKNPLHWDKAEAGVGMGLSFARELLMHLNSDDTIGLVPCAAGGTTIDQWLSNAHFAYTGNFYLYDNLLNRARQASKSGPIIGMIWHQGEENATESRYTGYGEKCAALFAGIRNDLALPNMPIVVGEIGRFLSTNASRPRFDSINAAINRLPEAVERLAVAPSVGLTPKSDNTHFISASQDTLGIRYARLLLALIDSGTTTVSHPAFSCQKAVGFTVIPGRIVFDDIHKSERVDIFNTEGRLMKSASVSAEQPWIATGDLRGCCVIKVSGDPNGTSFKITLSP